MKASAVKRPRGRPRKKPSAAHKDAAAVLSDYLTSESVMAVAPPSSQEELEKKADGKLREAIINMMQVYATAIVGKLDEDAVKKLVTQEIRADPRTEELKLVKRELESLRKDVAQDYDERKKTKELDDRILSEAMDLKRKHSDLQALFEPQQKRMTNAETQQKALMARMNAMEDRVRAVELK